MTERVRRDLLLGAVPAEGLKRPSQDGRAVGRVLQPRTVEYEPALLTRPA
jgi:hypothetical protein